MYKLNVNKKLKLTSSIATKSESTLVWSLEDNSQVNISSLALKQPFKKISRKVKSRSYYSFDIAINSNVLTAGASYPFQLSCF